MGAELFKNITTGTLHYIQQFGRRNRLQKFPIFLNFFLKFFTLPKNPTLKRHSKGK